MLDSARIVGPRSCSVNLRPVLGPVGGSWDGWGLRPSKFLGGGEIMMRLAGVSADCRQIVHKVARI